MKPLIEYMKHDNGYAEDCPGAKDVSKCESVRWHMDDSLSYRQIVESMEMGEVRVWADFGSYQGDTFVLIRRNRVGTEWAYLSIGWGSCSGCDALESCDDLEELEELRKGIAESAHCLNTAEMLRYLQDDARTRDWSWHSGGWKQFRAAAVEELTNGAARVGEPIMLSGDGYGDDDEDD